MSIAQTMPLARGNLQKNPFLTGQEHILLGVQSRVSQDINPCLDGLMIGAAGHRLNDRLPVNQDELGTQRPRPGSQRDDQSRRKVSELNSGDDPNFSMGT